VRNCSLTVKAYATVLSLPLLLLEYRMIACLGLGLRPNRRLQRDGSHDFDFLIGDWKAHVRGLPERLKPSNVWVEYDGISNQRKRAEFSSSKHGKAAQCWCVMWLDVSPTSSRIKQSFSPDGGKTWDVNWICELSE
jgi:hypothetical protein